MLVCHVASVNASAGQEVILRNGLAWTLLYHGLPIIYYGTEQPAIAGVADQRTAMWPHYGTDTPMYGWLAQVNNIRKKYGLSHGGAQRLNPIVSIKSSDLYSVFCKQCCSPPLDIDR